MGENMDLPGDTTRDGCAGTLLMQEMRDRITALESDLALYRDFFTESPTGKSMTTPDGGLTRVNTAFCRLLGYTPEELAAMSFTSITHPDDLAESRECVRALLAGECETWHMDKRYIRKGGEVVWAHVTTSLKRDAEGRPLHLRTHVEDLTARKRAEDALRERQHFVPFLTRHPSPLLWSILKTTSSSTGVAVHSPCSVIPRRLQRTGMR
jgi:PAS domain S-box-containing protein